MLRTLGELNAGRVRAANRLEAIQQSAPLGGSSQFRDLLRVPRAAYRSDTPVRLATFGTLRFPSILSTQLNGFPCFEHINNIGHFPKSLGDV